MPKKQSNPSPPWWGESSGSDEEDNHAEMKGTKPEVGFGTRSVTSSETGDRQKEAEPRVGEDKKGVTVIRKRVATKKVTDSSPSDESSAGEDDWLVQDEDEYKPKRKKVAMKRVAGVVKGI